MSTVYSDVAKMRAYPVPVVFKPRPRKLFQEAMAVSEETFSTEETMIKKGSVTALEKQYGKRHVDQLVEAVTAVAETAGKRARYRPGPAGLFACERCQDFITVDASGRQLTRRCAAKTLKEFEQVLYDYRLIDCHVCGDAECTDCIQLCVVCSGDICADCAGPPCPDCGACICVAVLCEGKHLCFGWKK
jgi:hypothetical protein